MTTIAYKHNIIAADSRETWSSEEGGTSIMRCAKLFTKKLKDRDVVIALAGASMPGMVFLDWYGSGAEPPECLTGVECENFDAVILDMEVVYIADRFCRPVKVEMPYGFFAVGSGRKVAMGAMLMGATAFQAVEAACKIDPYTAPPITTAVMPVKPKRPRRRGGGRAPAK